MLNDMMQSLAPALYPVFRDQYSLSFFQTGIITFTFQVTASLLQPLIGMFTDRRPVPYALPSAMAFTLVGLVALAFSTNYPMLLGSVALIGVGSAIFHPEASRVARAASGGRFGFAQSLFQVGGNFGPSLGPLMAAFIVVPGGQHSVLAFTALAFIAILLLSRAATWHVAHRAKRKARRRAAEVDSAARRRRPLAGDPRRAAVLEDVLSGEPQQLLHVLPDPDLRRVAAERAGAAVRVPRRRRGGHLHRRPDRRPHRAQRRDLGLDPRRPAVHAAAAAWLGLTGTVIDTIAIGLILSSAFSAMVVYAQELAPGNVGAIAGLFFGLSFGLGGIGAAALGFLADKTSLTFVYQVCAFLPAIGLLTYFLPDTRKARA